MDGLVYSWQTPALLVVPGPVCDSLGCDRFSGGTGGLARVRGRSGLLLGGLCSASDWSGPVFYICLAGLLYSRAVSALLFLGILASLAW